MLNQKLRSQRVSHRVINYLNALLQGKFAFQNILSQLNSAHFSLEAVKQAKAALARVSAWSDKLWDGDVLLDEARLERQSEEAQEAFDLLNALLPELSQLATQIKSILMTEGFENDKDSVALLIAAFALNAYARDNYVRGFLEFGRIFNDPDLAAHWKRHLPEVEVNIKQANELLLSLKENKNNEPNLYKHLAFICRTLPGRFRANMHDIRQLLTAYRGEFTYERAGMEKHEARLWERHEIPPVEAGYWRAHGFSPEEALEWKRAKFIDPAIAAEWNTIGFEPAYAAKWQRGRMLPLVAYQWHMEEFSPEEAIFLSQKGFFTPFELPKDQIHILLAGQDLTPPAKSAEDEEEKQD